MNFKLLLFTLLGSVVVYVGLRGSYCSASSGSSRNVQNPDEVEQIILAMNYFSSQRSLPCKFRVSYVRQEDDRSKVSISDHLGVMAEAVFSKDDFCGTSMRVRMVRQISSAETNNGTEYVGSAALFAYWQIHGFYDDFDGEVISNTNRSVSVFFDSSSLRIGAHCLVTVSFMKDEKVFCFSPGK